MWGPLFFIAAVPYVVVFQVTVAADSPPPGPAWWQVVLSLTLLPLGAAAPFGTTILGWVAISQIRHSCSRLYALGLAVFDALAYPLLVSDALILAPALLMLRSSAAQVPGQVARPWIGYWWVWLAAFALIVVVDWLIVRAVRRTASKPSA